MEGRKLFTHNLFNKSVTRNSLKGGAERTLFTQSRWLPTCLLLLLSCVVYLIANSNAPCVQHDRYLLFGDLVASQTGVAGIGNIVFELLALIGIARALNRVPALDSRNTALLNILRRHEQTLPNLLEGVELMEELPGTKKVYFLHDFARIVDFKKAFAPRKETASVRTLLKFTQSFKFFDSLSREEILHRLAPSANATSSFPELFEDMQAIEDADHVLCVHIRRGDFLTSLQEHSRRKFTRYATYDVVAKISRELRVRPTVVILGNDPEWSRCLFPASEFPVFVANTSIARPPTLDWAFARRHCQTVLLTASASTFGWWLAYQSRGVHINNSSFSNNNHVFYNSKSWKHGEFEGFQREDFFPLSWTFLTMETRFMIMKNVHLHEGTA